MENRWNWSTLGFAVMALLAHITGINGAPKLENRENRVEILPKGDAHYKALGSSAYFTCKPHVDNLELITRMEWIDPMNRSIENRNVGKENPSLYTEFNNHTKSIALYFNSLTEEQQGSYICRGQYSNQLLTKMTKIHSYLGITWEDAPTEQFPIKGTNYGIVCKVKANPPPSISWFYNTEPIGDNEHYIIEPYALKIINVQESDDGIYMCRASVDETGKTESRDIRVEVHTKPTIEEFQTSFIEVVEGEAANVVCKGTGKPPPKFTWTKSLTQQDLSQADRFSVNEITGSLTIKPVIRDDEGEYKCMASNAAGHTSMEIQIKVIVKPKISEFINQTAVIFKEGMIKCRAYGKPPPEVVFRKHTSKESMVVGRQPKDDRILLSNEPDEPQGFTDGIMRVDKVLRSDDGLYECIATNKGGSVTRTGHLTVEFPPTFENLPNRTAWSWNKKPVNLTCIAESIPNATIQWTHHSDIKVEKSEFLTVFNNGPISILQVVPVNRAYFSTYTCTATNKHGTASKKFDLREAEVPSTLQQAKIKETTATSCTFDLIPPATDPDLPLTGINVEYKNARDPWSRSRNKTWSIGSSGYIIEGLEPQTLYDFRFSATNEVGRGPWGGNIQESTQTRSRPSAPRFTYNSNQDYIISESNDKFELKWLAAVDNGERIDYYHIRYCQVKKQSNEYKVQEDACREIEERTRSLWLKDLQSDTYYQVEVRAHNILGLGKAGKLIFRTAKEPNGKVEESIVNSGAKSQLTMVAVAAVLMLLSLAY